MTRCVRWAAVLAVASMISAAQAPPSRPNFVFFLVDDLGWADLGCYGSTFHETPNVDKLAAGGMRFTDAYAACPVCSPTRASIMTGKHPVRVNITDWIPGSDPKGNKLLGPKDLHQLPLEEVTLAEALKEGGYRTFFAGKWHLGGKGFYPEDQGFDLNIGGHEKGSPPGGYYAPYKNPKMKQGPDGEYLTDRLAEESCRFLESSKGGPFLLYLAFYTVHTPIQACKRHVERFRAKAAKLPKLAEAARKEGPRGLTRLRQDNPEYASMVHAMDENVGRVLDKLEKLNLAGNTVVIFMSDNGGLSTKSKPGPTSNVPLRAGKGWCYEGGIREPMIIRWPGVTRPGATCSTPVTSHDFYPTMLEMAGLPLRPKQHVDGTSLVPLLKGGTIDRKALFWHYPHYHGSTWTPGGAMRMGDWKLVEHFEDNRLELYNLKNDLGETRDLAKSNPGKLKELHDALVAWRKRLGARMPAPNPRFGGGGKKR